MAFSASQRIEARCTRCKDLTSHIVIVVVDNIPAKVECCACGSIHKYHPPAGAKVAKKSSPLRVSGSQSRASAVENRARSEKVSSSRQSNASITKAMKESANNEQAWINAMNTHVGEPKEYSPSLEIAIGDTIDHSVFGLGIALDIVGADKASILFKEGYKTLKCLVN